MKCEKCGDEILDGAQSCLMCSVTQYDNRYELADESPSVKSPRVNNTVIAKISALVMIVVVSLGLASCHFDNIASDNATDAYFLLNQANRRNSNAFSSTNRGRLSGRVYVTEDAIYIATKRGEIVEFDHDFNQRSSFSIYDGRFGMLIHVTEDTIYYTLSHISGNLYRYDRATGENQQIASDIYHIRVVGDQVFHLNDRRIYGNIYVLNLTSGEKDVVFEGSVSEYFLNPVDNVIVLRDRDSLFRIDLEGNNLERITNDVDEFGYDGEIVTWLSRTDETLYTLNLATNEQTQSDIDVDALSSVYIMSDYIFSQGWYGFDLIGREEPTDSPLLGRDLQYFAVVGNYIIYERDNLNRRERSDNVYVITIGGESKVLIER